MPTRAYRLAAGALALGMLAAGCGAGERQQATAETTVATGSEPSPLATPTGAAVEVAGERQPTALPGPAQQRPPQPSPEPLPDTVTVHDPGLLVTTPPASRAAVQAAADVPGVEALAAASSFDIELVGQKETRILTALAVDPEEFRPLTPAVTAQTVGVWERLREGDIVVRHDVAHDLGLELGAEIHATAPTGAHTLRVGALASNGAPPVADLLVPSDLGRQLGATGANTVIVAVADPVDREVVGDAILAALGGGSVQLRERPVEEQAARLVGKGAVRFESFSYTSLGDGLIVIDPAWIKRWIVTIDLPVLGRTRCHRVMVPQLFAALEEIQEAGLYEHFKSEQFGGCYVPRHIDWNADKPLSMHAWGLAIDLNTHDNWLGETPTMDPRIVEIFERWGFEWGGRWARPDGMHFELTRVIEVGG